MRAKMMSAKRAPNKKGPRKLKSWPLFAAQYVYRVRLTTTAVVKITDSKITFPVGTKLVEIRPLKLKNILQQT